jgi:hypothetical protein
MRDSPLSFRCLEGLRVVVAAVAGTRSPAQDLVARLTACMFEDV